MDIILLSALLLWYLLLTTVLGKTDVRVLIPPVVSQGSTVTLLCLHNVTTDNLYSVKWYRGNYEFYRFVPKERPPTSTFYLPGLEVDINGSSGQQVTVRVLSRHISGQFTCEVSEEEPYFSTSSDSANLTVIELILGRSTQNYSSLKSSELLIAKINNSLDIGLRRPLLIPESSVHVSGTPLQINCSAQPTVPAPHISFFIDDIKVDKKLVKMVKPGLAVLEILKLPAAEGAQWVRCEASVGGVYYLSSASIPILEQHLPPGRSRSVLRRPSCSTCLTVLYILVLVQCKVTK